MILRERDIQFDFGDALEAVKFDAEREPVHGMKAVDFIAEYPDYHLFIEVKDPGARNVYRSTQERSGLVDRLVKQFRDSLLYRWCEGKLDDRPVHYRCLVETDSALLLYINKKLRKNLSANKPPKSWKRRVAESCVASNIEMWNKKFDDVVVKKLP